MWIEDSELIRKIEDQEIDYRTLFLTEESQNRIYSHEMGHLFDPPSHIELRLLNLELEVSNKAERHNKDLEYFNQQIQYSKERV